MFQLFNVLLIFNTLMYTLIGHFTTFRTSEKFPNIFFQNVIHNEYTHTGASKGSSPKLMFYIILVCSTDLICVLFTPYACALGVMLHGIDIGAERSMPITLTPTPTPTHYRYHAQN